MSKVIASITTSVDGYVTGPDDGPEFGLGRGGERLHYWVMGGPWTYEGGHDFAMHGPDKEFYDELVSTMASNVFYLTMSFYYFYVIALLAIAAPAVFARRLNRT